MATQLEADDDFTEDAPDLDLDADDDEDQPSEAESDDEAPEDEQPADEEDVVTFGSDDVRGEEEPEGIRNLRNRLREVERENRALKGQPTVDEVGARPKLEDSDYDEDAHADAIAAWLEKKRGVDQRRQQQEAAQRQAQEKLDGQLRGFEDGWSALRVTGKDAARAKVEDTFDATQQAMLIKASRGNAAGLFMFLGTSADSRDKLKALIDDPAEFIAEAAVMAKEVRVERRKPTTTPTEPVRGGTGGAVKGDARRARLERDADASGDYSALIKYDREMEIKNRGK